MSDEEKKPGRRSEPRVWLYTEHWLWGSTRSEMTIEERAVFIDLLCLGITGAGKVDISYPDQLAGQLLVPPELFKSCIEKGIKSGKFAIKNFKRHLTDFKRYLIILNWKRYQPEYLHDGPEKSTKRTRSDKGGKHDAHVAPIEEGRGEESREENRSGVEGVAPSTGKNHYDTKFEFLKRLRILHEELEEESEDPQNEKLYNFILNKYRNLDPIRELDSIHKLFKKNINEVKERIKSGKPLIDQLYALFEKAAEYAGLKGENKKDRLAGIREWIKDRDIK